MGIQYYIAHKGRKYGPLSLAELASRRLSDDMQAWREDLPDWVPIASIEELRPYVHHSAATRTTTPPAPPWGGSRAPTGAGQPLPEAGWGLAADGFGGGATIPPPPSPSGRGRVKFLGVTTVVLASLGLLCCPVGIAGVWLQSLPPEMEACVDVPSITIGRTVIHGVLLLMSVSMLAAGVGLLQGRRWAIVVGSLSSTVCLVTYVAAFVFECGFFYLPLMTAGAAEKSDEGTAIVLGGLIVNGLVTVAGLAWHASSLAILNSKIVRSYLR